MSARSLAAALAASAAVGATGCAQLLGLDDTKYAPLDAPTDAPSVCDGAPLACTSTSGRSVCGHLIDTGDGAGRPLRAPDPTGEACAAAEASGPCALTVAALPLSSYFDRSDAGRLTGVVDDCGRFAVQDLDPAAVDLAITFEGVGFQDTAMLVLARAAGPGLDTGIAAYAVSEATRDAWAAQLGVAELTTGYLVRYTTSTGALLAGEAVAVDGGSSLDNPFGTVPWAAYFAGTAAFATLDPAARVTGPTGAAFTVPGNGTFSLDGFRTGRRCSIPMLEQVNRSFTFVTATGC